jgi:hypothetical protein
MPFRKDAAPAYRPALQLRLVVIEVERGRRAVLVQPDHGLDLAREVRLLGGQRVDQFGGGGRIDVAETGMKPVAATTPTRDRLLSRKSRRLMLMIVFLVVRCWG